MKDWMGLLRKLDCRVTSVEEHQSNRMGEHKSSLKPLSLSTGSRQYTGCHRKDHMLWSTCLPDRWEDLIPLIEVIG